MLDPSQETMIKRGDADRLKKPGILYGWRPAAAFAVAADVTPFRCAIPGKRKGIAGWGGRGEHLVAKRAPASEVRTVKAELDNVNQDTFCVLKEVSQSNMCLNKNIICSVMNKS